MNSHTIIQARIDELQADLDLLVETMKEKKWELSNPDSQEPVKDIMAFLQQTTVQVVGLRSAIAELKNIKELV